MAKQSRIPPPPIFESNPSSKKRIPPPPIFEEQNKTVMVDPVPAGEQGQDGWAQVFEMPQQTITAERLPKSEEKPEDRRVKEFITAQQAYDERKKIPRIGVPGSREYQIGEKIENIGDAIRRNPFINPLAPTMGSIEATSEGIKKVREGVGEMVKGSTLSLLGKSYVPTVDLSPEARKGTIKAVAGTAQAVLGGAMTAAPIANYGFSAAQEIAPEISSYAMSPVATLTKPTTEEGQLLALIGDVIAQGAILHGVQKYTPKIIEKASGVAEKIKSKIPLDDNDIELILFLDRQESAGRNIQRIQSGRRVELANESNSKEMQRLKIDEQSRNKTENVVTPESTLKIFSEPKPAEKLPSLILDEKGNQIPIAPVREARAPLRPDEKQNFPYEGRQDVPIDDVPKLNISPEQLVKQTESLPAVEQGQNVPIVPELKNTPDAVSFGRKATTEQIAELEKLKDDAISKSNELLKKGIKGNEQAIREIGFKKQLYSEALDYAKDPNLKTPLERLREEKRVAEENKPEVKPEAPKEPAIDKQKIAQKIYTTLDELNSGRQSGNADRRRELNDIKNRAGLNVNNKGEVVDIDTGKVIKRELVKPTDIVEDGIRKEELSPKVIDIIENTGEILDTGNNVAINRAGLKDIKEDNGKELSKRAQDVINSALQAEKSGMADVNIRNSGIKDSIPVDGVLLEKRIGDAKTPEELSKIALEVGNARLTPEQKQEKMDLIDTKNNELNNPPPKPPDNDMGGSIFSLAGGLAGVKQDDDGNITIDPKMFLAGILLGVGIANVKLNPLIREKLARSIGKDVTKMTDEQIVGEYKKKYREINVREPNEKLYSENVRLDKFDDPAKVAEAISKTPKEDIASARRRLTDVEITELAKQQGEFVQKVREGKFKESRAYKAEEIQALQSELSKLIEDNKGKKEIDLSEGDRNIVKSVIGATYESGLSLRELSKGVSPEVANFLRTFDPSMTVKEKLPPSALEMLVEVAGAMKLASMSGIIRSSIGNATSSLLRPIEMVNTRAINLLLSSTLNKPRDRFSEEIMTSQIVGKTTLNDGLKTAWQILMADEGAMAKNAFLQAEGYSVEGAIPGTAGKIIRTPYRAQGAVDAIFREPLRDKELAVMAIRKAMQERGKDSFESMINKAQKYFDDAPQEWIDIADEKARYFTFQNKGGALMTGISSLRTYPIVKLFVPFFNTMANMFKYTNERTPFSVLTPSFTQAVWEAVSKREINDLTMNQKLLSKATGKDFSPGEIGHLSDKLSRMVTGSAILSATGILINKTLDGNITGSLPKKEDERKAWELINKKAHSIKWNGEWISYSGYEPMSSLLTAIAEYKNSTERGDKLPAAVLHTYKDFLKQYAQNPSFVGIKYLADGIFEEGSNQDKFDRGVSSFVVGLVVPTMAQQMVQVIDPRQKETEGIAEKISSRIPFATSTLKSRKNVFGEDIVTTRPSSRLFGFAINTESEDKINQEIARLGVAPLPPTDMYAGLKLTPEQTRELQIISGTTLKAALKPILESDGWVKIPDPIKLDVISEIKRKIYDAQRQIMFPLQQSKGEINRNNMLTDEEKQMWMDSIQ